MKKYIMLSLLLAASPAFVSLNASDKQSTADRQLEEGLKAERHAIKKSEGMFRLFASVCTLGVLGLGSFGLYKYYHPATSTTPAINSQPSNQPGYFSKLYSYLTPYNVTRGGAALVGICGLRALKNSLGEGRESKKKRR